VRHTSWIRFNKFTKIPSISEFTPRVKAQVLVSVTNNTKRRVWFSHFALVKLRRDNRRGNCFRWRWRERRQIKIFSRITNSEGLLARGPRIPTEITEVRVPKVKNVAPSFTSTRFFRPAPSPGPAHHQFNPSDVSKKLSGSRTPPPAQFHGDVLVADVRCGLGSE
jgi:hypothetical protein